MSIGIPLLKIEVRIFECFRQLNINDCISIFHCYVTQSHYCACKEYKK